MSMSFNEAVQQLEYNRQQLAIYNELVDFLRRFVDSETRRTEMGIKTVGCVNQVVDQGLILEEIEHIETEHIAPLMEAIAALENLQVVETNNGEEDGIEAGGQESRTKKKVGGKKARIKTKAGADQKSRRAVPRGVKQAG